jgi:hypothetical protein
LSNSVLIVLHNRIVTFDPSAAARNAAFNAVVNVAARQIQLRQTVVIQFVKRGTARFPSACKKLFPQPLPVGHRYGKLTMNRSRCRNALSSALMFVARIAGRDTTRCVEVGS